ncbi:MAG: hypothetical protein HY270_08120 [Deltaproteobacteria bacterium]|nr:hypothetical protein [Deltaproteobacteria bacterium]
MKGRNGWAIAASALLCVTGGRVSAQNALLVSGQASLAVIDTNGDGPDSTDCQFGALLSNLMSGPPMTADMLIAGSQSNTPLLRACQLSFDAAGTKGSDTSSNFASAYIYNAHGPMGFNFPNSLPLIAELVDETPNPNTNNPVMMNDLADAGSVQDERVSQPVLGGLCRAGGGAVARIQMSGAPGLLVDLSLYPNSMNPSYLKVPGPPLVFEKAAGGFQSWLPPPALHRPCSSTSTWVRSRSAVVSLLRSVDFA